MEEGIQVKKLVMSLLLANFGCVVGMERQSESGIDYINEMGVLAVESPVKAFTIARRWIKTRSSTQYLEELRRKIMIELFVIGVHKCQGKNNREQSCCEVRKFLKKLDGNGPLNEKIMSRSFSLNLGMLYDLMKIKNDLNDCKVLYEGNKLVDISTLSTDGILRNLSSINAQKLAAWMLNFHQDSLTLRHKDKLLEIVTSQSCEFQWHEEIDPIVQTRVKRLVALGALSSLGRKQG